MKIAVIGAGPSGMMAAFAAASNHDVTIFEKNEKLGKKLYITGKGRCNLTNYVDASDFFKNVISNKKFVYSSIYSFDPFMTMDLFNSYGLQLKVERGNRVFPMSDKASDVIKTYEKMLKERNVKIFLNTLCKTIDKKDKFIINGKYSFDKVIIATGGISYKETGSTGDGYKFAKNFGHKLIEPKASLSPLYIKDKLPIKALNISNVAIHAKGENKSYFEYGDILISNSLITGPAAMRFKARICRDKLTKVWIDFLADYSKESLDKVIVDLINESPKKNLTNSLKNLINESLLEIILERSNINKDIKSYELNKAMRHDIITMIKEFKLNLDTRENFNNAVITSGGIDVKEINPQSMESKLVKNLYFVGEVLDIDALTGGYNLQIAFSTAYAASLAIKEKIWHI